MIRLMLRLVVCFATISGLASSSATGAEDKAKNDNAKKIVGKWTVTKAEGVPEGAVIDEFACLRSDRPGTVDEQCSEQHETVWQPIHLNRRSAAVGHVPTRHRRGP